MLTLSVAPKEGGGRAGEPLLIFWLSDQPVARLFMLLRKSVLVSFLEVDARYPGEECRSLLP